MLMNTTMDTVTKEIDRLFFFFLEREVRGWERSKGGRTRLKEKREKRGIFLFPWPPTDRGSCVLFSFTEVGDR